MKEIEKNILAALEKQNLKFIWKEIEIPIIPMIKKMNENGFKIDLKKLKTLSKEFNNKIKKLENEIHIISDENFNVKSTQQLAKILFEKLNLPTKGIKKTPKGVFSTKESELQKLKEYHPIVEKLLTFRELTKLTSTYIDNLIPKIEKDQNHRLHYEILQLGTSTGRMASKNPNIQNIPVLGKYGQEIRKVFIAEKGFKLVAFDYSQIELRLAAIISQDKKMIESFKNNEDIHSTVAKEIFGSDHYKNRQKAKVINFGILYGMGVNSLTKSLGTDRKKAQIFLNDYFKKFNGIADYIKKTKKSVYEKGFSQTLYGRKRFFPEINSKLPFIRASVERMAINAPIQGSSADIIKLAMKEIWSFLEKNKLIENVKPIAQIHDELIFEIKEDLVKKISLKIKKIMENVLEKNPIDKTLNLIPLLVKPKIGKNWSELK